MRANARRDLPGLPESRQRTDESQGENDKNRSKLVHGCSLVFLDTDDDTTIPAARCIKDTVKITPIP
jgi:hypothetical protein